MKGAKYKGHILCHFVHKKYPEQANPQRQKVDERLPGI